MSWRKTKPGHVVRKTTLAVSAAALAGSFSLLTVGGPSWADSQASRTPSVVGTWSVTYGAPAVVSIKLTGTNSYTMRAVTRVKVTGGSCSLLVGTVIAKFSGTGTMYSGTHGLWNTVTCAHVTSTSLSLTLSENSMREVLGNGEHHILTRVL